MYFTQSNDVVDFWISQTRPELRNNLQDDLVSFWKILKTKIV